MWGDGVVPKFGVYFCHTISRIFEPFIERTSKLVYIIVDFNYYSYRMYQSDFNPHRTEADWNFFSKFINILKGGE